MTEQSILIELRHVTKHYPDGDVQALDGVDLTIQRGEFVSIVGASGCGKTTLLNMIGGLDRPTFGEVSFAGQKLVRDTNLDQHRRHHIGFVFQTFHLLPNLTAIENVQLPMFGELRGSGERHDRAKHLLDQVGLADRCNHLPGRLSNGQRQRVAIARSLANSPSLVLADEPTGALDRESGDLVMQLLTSVCREKDATLIVVTHDDRIAAKADRVIRLEDGRIVADEF